MMPERRAIAEVARAAACGTAVVLPLVVCISPWRARSPSPTAASWTSFDTVQEEQVFGDYRTALLNRAHYLRLHGCHRDAAAHLRLAEELGR